ncbi:MAG: hypothetical protein WCV90_00800 [Candidatus Woesearchaeota archaeon]
MRYLTKLSLALTFVASVYSSTALSQVKWDKESIVGLERIVHEVNPVTKAAEWVALVKGPGDFYGADYCDVPKVGLQMQLEQDLQRVNDLVEESEQMASPVLELMEGKFPNVDLIVEAYAKDRRSTYEAGRLLKEALSLQNRGASYYQVEEIIRGTPRYSLEGLEGLGFTKERGRELEEMNRERDRTLEEIERVRSKVEGRFRGKVK